jgi:hypothetical protein
MPADLQEGFLPDTWLRPAKRRCEVRPGDGAAARARAAGPALTPVRIGVIFLALLLEK